MKFLILKIIQTDIIIHVQYIGPYVKYRFFCQILIIAEYSWYILARYLKQISWKLAQWQNICFMWTHKLTDGQTDITMLIVRFLIFVSAP